MNAKTALGCVRAISGTNIPVILACLFASCAVPVARAALGPKQVLVLVNKDTPISSQVGRMYEKLREIPAANVLTSLPRHRAADHARTVLVEGGSAHQEVPGGKSGDPMHSDHIRGSVHDSGIRRQRRRRGLR